MACCSRKNNKWDDSSHHQSFSRVIVDRGLISGITTVRGCDGMRDGRA